jgi:hypothetical protein
MITDARAQVDLFAARHLEALIKIGHSENASNQSNLVTRAVTAAPHSPQYDSLQLRDRLAVIQTLAVRARGLTVKTDMAQYASTRKKDSLSLQSANAAAEEDIHRRNVW